MADHKPASHTERYAALIRRYFDACNEVDYDKLVSCFTPNAVHYFLAGLPDIPWRGADVIARKWQWCVAELGSQWTIEKILVSHDSHEAMIEWTHWKSKPGTALWGDEWYVFDPDTCHIKEIRAYYASPADKSVAINELVNFDYTGRGYNLKARS
ncbi:hypothetical protein BHUM_00255 [Candidatus Burkholderia humilis]|nr:hypothetical protein BHUM_00255 [Candidatus Burkholderia humilis]